MENLACDLRFSLPTEQAGVPNPGPRTSTALGTQLQSRRCEQWVSQESFICSYSCSPMLVLPPPVRSGAALDFHRGWHTALNCICMRSRLPAQWESSWNQSPPASNLWKNFPQTNSSPSKVGDSLPQRTWLKQICLNRNKVCRLVNSIPPVSNLDFDHWTVIL